MMLFHARGKHCIRSSHGLASTLGSGSSLSCHLKNCLMIIKSLMICLVHGSLCWLDLLKVLSNVVKHLGPSETSLDKYSKRRWRSLHSIAGSISFSRTWQSWMQLPPPNRMAPAILLATLMYTLFSFRNALYEDWEPRGPTTRYCTKVWNK